jgi:hypothetical protein
MATKLPTRVLALLATTALLAVAGRADEEKAADGKSCREEVEALCPDSEPASPERHRCVGENVSRLSEDCRAQAMRRRNSRTAGIEALRGACGQEIDEYCDEVRRGSGRLLRCLGTLEEEKRSAACGEYLDVLSRMRGQRRGPGVE